MNKIDHIALVVDHIQDAAEFYSEKLNMDCLYSDSTWALLRNEHLKIALVLEDSHPCHIAIRCESKEQLEKKGNPNQHRDGSLYVYEVGPSGNAIEWIYYPPQ